jgi:ATP-dependent DNA helicase DinG
LMLCDPRLLSKAYGRIFLASLPPMTHTRVLSDVQGFFAEEAAVPADMSEPLTATEGISP